MAFQFIDRPRSISNHIHSNHSSASIKPKRRSLVIPHLTASTWRLNAGMMQIKLASAGTLNELLLTRTGRRWFV